MLISLCRQRSCRLYSRRPVRRPYWHLFGYSAIAGCAGAVGMQTTAPCRCCCSSRGWQQQQQQGRCSSYAPDSVF